MQRTYDVFVDNGLFVLSYYLDKDIEDITETDVIEGRHIMNEKIVEFCQNSSVIKIKGSAYLNSIYDENINMKKILEKQHYSLTEKGTDTCSICGCRTASIKNPNFHRGYLPLYVSNAFFNFSNNLRGINICPICFILSMYSILNISTEESTFYKSNKNGKRLYETGYYYLISEDDECMYDNTYIIQENLKSNLLLNTRQKPKCGIKLLEEIVNSNKIYGGNISIYIFRNGKAQDQREYRYDVSSQNLRMLSNISKSGMLNEFKQCGLMYDLMLNSINHTYLNKITKDDELICSKELFDILNIEVNNLSEDIKSVIRNVSERLVNEDRIKIRKRLKLIKTFKDFERLLVDIADEYDDKYYEPLYSVDEYVILDNKLKYNQIKNLLIVSLMQ